jgi:hypothetical protein
LGSVRRFVPCRTSGTRPRVSRRWRRKGRSSLEATPRAKRAASPSRLPTPPRRQEVSRAHGYLCTNSAKRLLVWLTEEGGPTTVGAIDRRTFDAYFGTSITNHRHHSSPTDAAFVESIHTDSGGRGSSHSQDHESLPDGHRRRQGGGHPPMDAAGGGGDRCGAVGGAGTGARGEVARRSDRCSQWILEAPLSSGRPRRAGKSGQLIG